MLKYLKNKYFIVSILFIVWVGFLDPNNLVNTMKIRKELRELNANKGYYLKEIEQTRQMRDELVNNKELLEKFARENYYFIKPGEEIFLVDELPGEDEEEDYNVLR